MRRSVASLAKAAFDAAAKAVSGVVHPATISRRERGPWNASVAGYDAGTLVRLDGRAVNITARAKEDSTFGDWVWTAGDEAFLLEGLTGEPQMGDMLSIGTIAATADSVSGSLGDWKIVAGLDVSTAGSVFTVIARKARMMERRFAPLEYRGEGRTLEGVAVKYGDTARLPFGSERFEPGAFGDVAGADVILNVQHDRGRPIARTGGGLVLEDSREALAIRADLPATREADDALELVRAKVLRGL